MWPYGGYEACVDLLQKVADAATKEGVFVSVAKYSFLDRRAAPPSLKVAVNVEHTHEDIARCANVIRKHAKAVFDSASR